MKKFISPFFIFIFLSILGFNFYSKISSENESKASNKMFNAVYKFEEGKYDEALEGDENNYGFEQVIKEFKSTSVGDIAHLYAASSWLHLYNVLFDRAKCQMGIDHLKYLSLGYSDVLKGKVNSLLGDLYCESGFFNEGGLAFMSAAYDDYTPYYLFKASIAFPEVGRSSQAVDALKKIIKEFPEHPYAEKARQRLAALK